MAQWENHHLGVFFYVNIDTTPPKFRLGTSVLGGTHVLGSSGTGKSWQNFQEYASEINVDNTITLTGIDPEYNGLTIDLLLTADTDILAGTGFSVGTWIKITLEHYVPSFASYPIFYVKVKNYTKELDSYGQFVYNIHAQDVLQDVLATPITDYDSATISVTGEGAEIINGSSALFRLNPLPIPDFGDVSQLIQTDVGIDDWGFYDDFYILEGSYSEVVQPITQGGAVWWFNKGNDPVIYGISLSELTSGAFRTPVLTFASDETDSRIDVDYVNVTEDSLAIVNDVLLSLDWDPATTVQYVNQDLVDVYGRNKQEISFNYRTETELGRYQALLADNVNPQVIKSLGVDAIHHKNRKLSNVWELYPSSMVTVDIATDDLTISDNFYVTGVRHTITPDGWNTTVDLWRSY
jgi:hypothetical protein